MAWDFETDPEYQKKLDLADGFVREELDGELFSCYSMTEPHAGADELVRERRGSVLLARLNRPEARNALMSKVPHIMQKRIHP